MIIDSLFFVSFKLKQINVYSKILVAFQTFLSVNVKISVFNKSVCRLERGFSSQLSSLIRKGFFTFGIGHREPSIYLQLGKCVCCCCLLLHSARDKPGGGGLAFSTPFFSSAVNLSTSTCNNSRVGGGLRHQLSVSCAVALRTRPRNFQPPFSPGPT